MALAKTLIISILREKELFLNRQDPLLMRKRRTYHSPTIFPEILGHRPETSLQSPIPNASVPPAGVWDLNLKISGST